MFLANPLNESPLSCATNVCLLNINPIVNKSGTLINTHVVSNRMHFVTLF
jgi:hypothetical protein